MNSSRTSWIALLAVGTAIAQEPPRGEGGGKGDKRGGGRMAEMWKRADIDGDGFISAAEFAAMKRPGQLPEEKRDEIFKRLDKNGDGRIGPDELPRRPHGGGMQPLEEVDADKDGRITFGEFQKLGFVAKLPEERQRRIFKRMDRDGDGVLTPKDRPEGGPRGGKGGRGGHPLELVKKLDRNGDGALGFEEFRQAEFLKDKSEDEQEDRFEAMDRNGDLKIDAADFPPPGDRKPKRPAEAP